MRKLVLGLALVFAICILSGCNASPEATKGDYIISKEDQRILVAKNITQKDSESKTFAEFKKNNIELINYIVEDTQLYNELEIGEKVNVTPKTNDKGEYTVMQSDPPQIIAGQIERLKD
ncbi:hypothetical protein J45TS6_20660 [Paenibacillus sp. J45TS6]|uniref:DUF3221 domain-containing protein n=1 Tax=Paenibacillus sp. J45TS6 TaxID=2807196 RepID=UPI001B26A896|nr:DUF3221 domain-containing protein [Paenibacillus sp. J45TS6]GIP43607.1 hypothetical protein J45TS6_20660 [Paenibacillus sp. J45TS6]